MIESVHFKNFKVLRDTTLPLSRFTLIVGPNGSGKSTALQALQAIHQTSAALFQLFVSASLQSVEKVVVEVLFKWGPPYDGIVTKACWSREDSFPLQHVGAQGIQLSPQKREVLDRKLAEIPIYSLDAPAIADPVTLNPDMKLTQSGHCLAGVLDRLRDREPERFELLNEELGRWFPDFDRILFDTPESGKRVFLLRTRNNRFAIPAADLSQGTLLAFALLTLTYLPDPPSIICLEEPDRGIHPRLLREIQDALYRLSYPESCGEKRDPVQVIATTHSPYFLDLYRDHPEEVVIAHKTKDGGRFERLSEQPHIMEILGDAPLGEVWYSGILGGVPAEQ